MKATTIAHLTGQMDAILKMMEFSIQETKMGERQDEYLIKQIQKAAAINDEIFEMYKRNELDRIKKIHDYENK